MTKTITTDKKLVILNEREKVIVNADSAQPIVSVQSESNPIKVSTNEAKIIVGNIIRGLNGISAYQIAVLNGFIGSEKEWLESLQGEKGEKGVEGVKGADGADGLSAYALAVLNGFIGNEEEWVVSLQGADGKDGLNGKDGVDGRDGLDGKDGRDGVDGRDGETGTVDETWLEHIDEILENLNQDLLWLNGLLLQVNIDLDLNKEKIDQLNLDLDELNNVTLVQVNIDLEQARIDLESNRQNLLELQNVLVQVNADLLTLNNDIENIRDVTSDLDDVLQNFISSIDSRIDALTSDVDGEIQNTRTEAENKIQSLREEANLAIQALEQQTLASFGVVNNSLTQLDNRIEEYREDFDERVTELTDEVDERIERVRDDLARVRDSVTLDINTNMLNRRESDRLIFDTLALATQLRQNQVDITNVLFEVDPATGTIRNLAYAYADNQFTQAGLLIDGVNAEINLQAQRVIATEERITNAESTLSLQAGQISARATFTQMEQYVGGALEAIQPAYSFGFFNSAEGWVAVNGTLTPANSKINLTLGDIQNISLEYNAKENPIITISILRTEGDGWVGDLIITFDDNSTRTFSNVIDNVPIGTAFVRSLNLAGNIDYTGTTEEPKIITGVRFKFGTTTADVFSVNSITIGKPSAVLQELDGITAQINQVGLDLDALGATLTGYVTVDTYNAEGVTRSNVESVLNGIDSYASITATLQEFDENETLTKANYAAVWVDAANANIRQQVQAYRVDELDPDLENIRGTLTVASSRIDAADGKITDQIVSISGIRTQSRNLAQVALQAEYQLYLSRRNQLEQGVAIAIAKNEINTITNEQLALAEEILLLEAKFGTDVGQVNATLFELNRAIASETEARVEATQVLEADFNQTINASASVILEVVSNAEMALSQEIQQLQAQFNSDIGATTTSLLQAIATEQQARITSLNQLSANFANDIQATRTELIEVISDETQALVSQINSVETEFQGNYATKFEVSEQVANETSARNTQILQLSAEFQQDIGATRTDMIELIADEESARISSISNLTAEFQTTYASKTEVVNIVADEQQARVQSINNLTANIENNFATINQLDEVTVDLDSAKAVSQKSLVSIAGVGRNADLTALEQLMESYRLYLAEKGQLEIGVSIARAEQGLTTLATEQGAFAEQLLVLDAKLGTANGTISANFSELNKAIVDEQQARTSSLTVLETAFGEGIAASQEILQQSITNAIEATNTNITQLDSKFGGNVANLINVQNTLSSEQINLANSLESLRVTTTNGILASVDQFNQAIVDEQGARSSAITNLKSELETGIQANATFILGTDAKANGNARAIAGLRTAIVGEDGDVSRAEVILSTAINDAGDAVSRAFLGTTTFNEGDDKYTITGLTVDSIERGIRFQGDLFELVNGAGLRRLYWQTDTNEWQIDGNVLVSGTIRGTALVAEAITADKIAANSISAGHIQANSIGTAALIAESITAEKIVSFTITGEQIAARSIGADRIIANSIGANEITANSIDATKIVAYTITGELIAANTIGADKIIANSIGANQIAANSITGNLIEANALNGKVITGSLIQTALSGTRVVLGNSTLPLWYGTGDVTVNNASFYVDAHGNVVGKNKFKINVGEDLLYFDETTNTLTFKGKLVLGDNYQVNTEDDIRALDGNFIEYRYREAATQPAIPTGLTPSGWSTTPPNTTNPIWIIQGTKNATNTQIIGTWSLPVRWNGLQGAAGAAAKSIALSSSSQSFKYGSDGVILPSSNDIVFTATGSNLAGSFSFSTNPTVTLTGTGATRTLTAANFGSNQAVKVTVTRDGLSDEITVVRLQDGANGEDAISAYLTNESHTVSTNSTGGGGVYTTAGGEMRVFNGTTRLTSGVTYSVVNVTSGLSISVNSSGVYTVTNSTVDSATATVRAVFNGVTLDKVYTLTKSKAGTNGTNGINGVNGANARVIALFASSQSIAYRRDNSRDTNSITFTTSIQGLSGGVYEFQLQAVRADGTSSPATATSDGSTTHPRLTVTSGTAVLDTSSAYSAFNPNNEFVNYRMRVRYLVGGNSLAEDILTIAKLYDGSEAVTILLSNEAHVVPASNTGVVTSMLNSGTTIKAFQGATALTFRGTGSNNTYPTENNSFHVFRVFSTNMRDAGSISGDATTEATQPDYGNIVGDGSVADWVDFNIRIRDKDGIQLPVITKRQTLTKSKAGVNGTNGINGTNGTNGTDGVNAISGYLTNESHVVGTNPEGTLPLGFINDAGGIFKVFNGTSAVTGNIFSITGFTGTLDLGTIRVKDQNGLRFRIGVSTGEYQVEVRSGGWISDTETFEVTATTNGVTITKQYVITKSKAGAVGAGFYGSTYTSISWTTSTASSRFTTLVGREPVKGDIFTQTRTDGTDNQARQFNGTSWVAVALQVNGAIVASGTIAGDKLIAGTEINAPVLKGGTFIVADDNVEFMSITRALPFGSANDLVEWFGPRINGQTWNNTTMSPIYTGMTKANAKTYKTKDGSVFFGGTFQAGVLSNALTSTILTASPSKDMTFGSNGGAIQIAASLSYSDTETNFSVNGCPSPMPAAPVVTVFIEQLVSGSWQIRSQQTFNGFIQCVQAGNIANGEPRIIQRGVGGTITHSDLAMSTANRAYRARAQINNYLTTDDTSVSISITSSED